MITFVINAIVAHEVAVLTHGTLKYVQPSLYILHNLDIWTMNYISFCNIQS